MKDLTPLYETSESGRTRALLRAGRADLPPPGFSDRLRVGLGLSVAVSGVSVAAAATASAATGATSTSGAAALGLVAAKWVVVGVIGGGILAGGVDLASSRVGKATRVTSAANAGGVPAPPLVPLPQGSSQAAPAPPESDPASSREMQRPAERGGTTNDVTSVKQGQLGREAQMIDRARRSLANGNPQRALVELDAFTRIAETDVLDREARVLRIDALYQVGQTSRARQLGHEYLQAYPNDAHAGRLHAWEQNAASR